MSATDLGQRHLGFFKKIILRKTAASFTEISRKHVFAASYRNVINPRSLLEKIVTRSLEGGSIGHPPSTFDTIHPFDLKFGTYNKQHFYFQLSETTCCLIGFHGNNNQINDVTGGRHLGFSNFQILFKFSLFYLRLTRKQHLEVEIHEIG